MKLKVLLTVFLLLTLTACSQKEIQYVDREVVVKVPQKCIVELPNGHIDERLNESEILVQLLKYTSELHRRVHKCQ